MAWCGGDLDLLLFYAVLTTAALVLIQVCRSLGSFILLKLGEDLTQQLRQQIYTSMVHMGMNRWKGLKTGDLVNRMVHELPQVTEFVTKMLPNFLINMILPLFGALIMFRIHVLIAFVVLVFQPLIFVAARKFLPGIRMRSEQSLKTTSDLNHMVEEAADNIQIVKYIHAYDYINEKISFGIGQNKAAALRLGKLNIQMGLCLFCLEVMPSLFVFMYGGYSVIKGAISFGDYMALVSYVSYLIEPTIFFAQTTLDFQKIRLILARFLEIVSLRQEPGDKIPVHDVETLELRAVSYAYGDAPIFQNISAVLHKGTIGWIRGRNGCGKTTLINLICGLVDTQTRGQIFFDGRDRQDIDTTKLIGVITQDTMLFDDTVYQNICLGTSYPREKILELAGKLGFSSIVEGENVNLDSMIYKNGLNLSGGQAQKINILRALIREPKVIIFDEFDTFLDAESKERVIRYIRKECRDVIVIMISHEMFQMEDDGAVVSIDITR